MKTTILLNNDSYLNVRIITIFGFVNKQMKNYTSGMW